MSDSFLTKKGLKYALNELKELGVLNNEPIKGVKNNWCSGYFKDRSLPANVTTLITPVYESGDPDMIQDGHFVATDEGAYILFTGMFNFNTLAYIDSGIYINKDTGLTRANLVATHGAFSNANNSPSIVFVDQLSPGDYLVRGIYSSVEQQTIQASIHPVRFFFASIK